MSRLNILVIHGPNLNLLGTRKTEIYGNESLADVEYWFQSHPGSKKVILRFFQSNHEGDIIDTMHGAREWASGIIINPGAFTHYSYAIRDAIEAINIPTIEVHVSDIHAREEFRKVSVIKPVCIDQISGLGKKSYLEGLDRLLKYLAENH